MKKNRLPGKNRLRVIISLFLMMLLASLAFFGRARGSVGTVLATLLFSVGGLLLVWAIWRLIFKEKARKSDRNDELNRQFGNILRELNAACRYVPSLITKLDEGMSCAAIKQEVKELSDGILKIQATEMERHCGPLLESIISFAKRSADAVKECPNDTKELKKALEEMSEDARVIRNEAAKQRTGFLSEITE